LEQFVLGKNRFESISCAALIKTQELSVAHLQPLPKPVSPKSSDTKDALAENHSLHLLFQDGETT
jgi:hypothetical protein